MAGNIFSKRLVKKDVKSFGKLDGLKKAPRWSELPSPVLELLYSYLSLKERYTLSMVCRSWYNEFESPSIWKSFAFDLSKDDFSRKYFSDIRCAQKFGKFFRHVQIVGNYQENLIPQLKLFLKVITSRCQLFSISFELLMFLKDYDQNIEVIQNISNLLKSQNHLKEISIKHCCFSEGLGYKILGAVAKLSTNLKKLKLVNFAQNSLNDNINEYALEAQQTFGGFMNLTEIEMDYGEVFENMIKVCSEMESAPSPLKSKSLKTIKLYLRSLDYRQGAVYRGSDFHQGGSYQAIDAKTVKRFRKQCPELKIDVLTCFAYGGQLKGFKVLKNMPIRSLHFENIIDYYDISSISDIISPENGFYLEVLEISQLKVTINLAQDLITLLQTCPNMRVLHLELQHLIYELGSVFNSLIENYRGFLKRICLVIERVKSRDDKDMFHELEREYIPKMQKIGVNLFMHFKFSN